MLHAVFQPQKGGLKINVARKVHVKKSCNEENAAGKSGVGLLIKVNAMSVNSTARQYRVISAPHSLLFKSLGGK